MGIRLVLLALFCGCSKPPENVGLGAGDPRARGCEVLLADGKSHIASVAFAGGVTGRWLRQGDKVAAAFVADRDVPLGAGALQISGGDFEVLRSHCYGPSGEE